LWRFARAGRDGDRRAIVRAIDAARRAGWPRAALEETALMLTIYAGYPAAIETLHTLATRWPAASKPVPEVPASARRRAGLAGIAGVYGPVRPSLLRELRRLHPALAVWVVEHGYGRVLARGGLDPASRELITVALLAGRRWPRQLASHRIGARRLGAPARRIAEALRPR
jgi:4-carboxymuconolactone decarboxylase